MVYYNVLYTQKKNVSIDQDTPLWVNQLEEENVKP